jgi:hypothetical protein
MRASQNFQGLALRDDYQRKKGFKFINVAAQQSLNPAPGADRPFGRGSSHAVYVAEVVRLQTNASSGPQVALAF